MTPHSPRPSRLPFAVLAAAVALLLALPAGALAPRPAAAADGYGGTVPSTCSVALRTTASGVLRATVGATLPGNVPAQGRFSVTFDRDGRTLRSSEVPYDGGSVTVDGPRATVPGRYGVTAVFTPREPSRAAGCRGSAGARAGVLDESGAANDPEQGAPGADPGAVLASGGGTGPGGGAVSPATGADAGTDGTGIDLPGTGGPALWLLALGAALLLVGAGAVARGRRPRSRRR
ncbi:hypothetical protein [Nocardioides litoris]|uniref:hypothetical protein n=1 Tax=Nocardioides litoris TaxID=1926648 RepID=UPI00112435B8|nr:hypothetical protein [Nocardioides litoris]